MVRMIADSSKNLHFDKVYQDSSKEELIKSRNYWLNVKKTTGNAMLKENAARHCQAISRVINNF